MNVERLNELASWCEAGCPARNSVVGLNMLDFITIAPGAGRARILNYDTPLSECGTVCCIAGTAVMWWGAAAPQKFCDIICFNDWAQQATKLLDLRSDQADGLFFPQGYSSAITPAIAATCIRQLIATGNVEWALAAKNTVGFV